jgi:2',3'-cyclic-nucleotide 2'-phosphodiesterase (5'-nucleotidase family)
MSSKMYQRTLIIFLTLVLVFSPVANVSAQKPTTVDLQFLSVTDWHAQLDPLSGVGGAAAISTYWQMDRANNPNTLTLTAGDAYFASPPLSSFFNEVPAVKAMNLMGFDVDTLGNHNFDKGLASLQPLIDLAEFQYVATNLKNLEDNLTGVKPFEIFEVGGTKVAVIGIANPETPQLVFPGSLGTIEITDPIPAANKALARAKAEGAKVFVAITHLGIRGFHPETGEPFGELIDFASNVGGFNLIYGDHTDEQYQGIINNALVVQARAKGRTYARVNLTVDPKNGRILSRSAEFVTPLASAVIPDPAIVAMLQPYRDALGPIMGTVVGESSVFVPRSDSCGRADGRLCESLIGNFTTDSMRLTYNTEFAITNSGGLRANLTCPLVDNPNDFCPPYDSPPYPITRGQVLEVLPFGNVVVTLSLDGAKLKDFLENGVSAMPGANGKFAQVSGLCFTYDISAPVNSRVAGAVWQAQDGSCTGGPVDLTSASTYTLATNDFVASGGDGYPVVMPSATTMDIMDQVLADFILATTPISPSIQGRITCTTSGATACPMVIP